MQFWYRGDYYTLFVAILKIELFAVEKIIISSLPRANMYEVLRLKLLSAVSAVAMWQKIIYNWLLSFVFHGMDKLILSVRRFNSVGQKCLLLNSNLHVSQMLTNILIGIWHSNAHIFAQWILHFRYFRTNRFLRIIICAALLGKGLPWLVKFLKGTDTNLLLREFLCL